ncbi:hypothetical protein [Streptomyces sp. NBC_00162]|uniref:hypothetical protein n=1 Tax=Streptomyces sp. NBC_00162 TaxID=2903629 RepID=UPI00214CBC1C|nr:hypothetical protein [Streptomyces sp. NBC_00162]UUU39490.1 hypothetical protein JIW86_12190 [Streptomyces sp. NBC_00162]
MLKLTAAGFAATTALVLATSGTAHALGDDKPAANRAAAVAKCPTDVRIDETAPVITRKDILSRGAGGGGCRYGGSRPMGNEAPGRPGGSGGTGLVVLTLCSGQCHRSV